MIKARRAGEYLILLLIAVFLGLFLILPIFTVIGVGCDWNLICEVFRNPIYVQGLINSFKIALATTFIVFVMSLLLALLYDRFEFPGKEWCGLLMLIPMILPPFVGALGFQQILGHYGILNTLLVKLGMARVDFLGSEYKFWSVCAIEALHLYPIFYLNLVTALGNIDPALDEAAANMGAGAWKRFRTIRLPLLKSGILAGGSIVLVWSFTELGTPLMFGYNRTTAVQILNGLTELESNPVPYALVLIMLVFSAALYTFSKLVLGRTSATSGKGTMGSRGYVLAGWKRFIPGAIFLGVTFCAALPHIALILAAFSKRYYGTILPEGFTLEYFEEALSNSLVLPSIVNSLRYSLLAMVIATCCGLAVSLASVRWKLRFSGAADVLAMLPLAVPGVVVAFGFLSMSVRYDWAAKCFNPVEIRSGCWR